MREILVGGPSAVFYSSGRLVVFSFMASPRGIFASGKVLRALFHTSSTSWSMHTVRPFSRI